MLRGEKKWLNHICAACWVKDKVKRVHSKDSDDCPNKPKPKPKPKERLSRTPHDMYGQDFSTADRQDFSDQDFHDLIRTPS